MKDLEVLTNRKLRKNLDDFCNAEAWEKMFDISAGKVERTDNIQNRGFLIRKYKAKFRKDSSEQTRQAERIRL